MAAVPTRAAFLASVPGRQFVAAPVDLIDAALEEAARETSTLYQSDLLAEKAVFLKAAVSLLRQPSAHKMRLADPTLMTVWEKALRDVQRAGMIGRRVF